MSIAAKLKYTKVKGDEFWVKKAMKCFTSHRKRRSFVKDG